VNNKYIIITEQSINLAKCILKKNYVSIVPAGTKILEQILDNSTDSEKDKRAKILVNFEKYGTFMVDIASAQNSNDIKEALSKNVTNYSFLDKRKDAFSFTLNADPGIVPGFEDIKASSKPGTFSFGITCPIGLDFGLADKTIKTNGTKNKGKQKRTYYGISINIFDIGAAFSYRLNDQSSDLPEKITFKQVFSPGIAVKHGFRNTHISTAFGYQYLPSLRSIDDAGFTEVKNAGRIFLRFTWDMPLAKIARIN
jgi:hypothetical protein